MIDPIALLQSLIQCPSVTPFEGGALTLLENLLTAHGFTCHRLKFTDSNTPDVENLYARRGTSSPHLCFAGHTDVVPVGDLSAWNDDPFGGVIKGENIYGRGACDMKGSIACFIAAVLNSNLTPDQSISFLFTGDEEGIAINGTRKGLDWLEQRGEKIDFCLVGEPTSRAVLGDMLKIGRRGTFTGRILVKGKQGHVAYPHLADNPVPKLLTLLKSLDDLVLDEGSEYFQASNLEIVNIDIGNPAENIIPAEARAVFNVRFNDHYSGATLEQKLRATLDACTLPYEMTARVGGESFYTPAGNYSDMIKNAITKVTGLVPDLSTTGGTSDARFIKNFCPVIEFGIVGATAHQVNEHVKTADLITLTEIYRKILAAFFKA